MLERCYQGDDPEYVDKHYKRMRKRFWREGTSKALANNLGKQKLVAGVVDNHYEDRNYKSDDAKDALFFMDL